MIIYKGEEYNEYITNEGGTTYYVSRNGKVISKKVHVHELHVFVTDKGYMYVKLTINKKTKAEFIHRLVAKVYIPNPDNKPEVNHKDGVKSNNSVGNLEWVTSKENKEHAWKNNLANVAKGENNGNTNLTNDAVRNLCKLMSENRYTLKEISKMTGIDKNTINAIRNRRTWIEISKDYIFPEKPMKSRKHDEYTINTICLMIEKGYGTTSISKVTGVNISIINDIKHHRVHNDISKYYNF